MAKGAIGSRAFAILIGILMIGSTAGYAFLNVTPGTGPAVPEIPTIVDRPLTTDEQVFVLRTGRVLIQNFYSEDCTHCPDRTLTLNGFVNGLVGYVVLENVLANETRLEMIGVNGKIVPIEDEALSQESLMDVFCDIAIKQPRQCLLMDL
jgi:hypothetical protein